MKNPKEGDIILYQYVDLAGFLRSLEAKYEDDDLRAAFDGSSVYGFRSIEDSDLHLVGDPETLRPVPWLENTYRVLSEIYLPSGERYERDPRYIARRVEEYARSEFGFDALVGVEVEFFLLDKLELNIAMLSSGVGYSLTSSEHPWTPNAVGVFKKAYHSVEPIDKILDYRLRLHKYMDALGHTKVEVTHHEVALAQMEADIQASTPLKTADNVVTFKWVARRLALEEGKLAVFLPKPIYGDNGSGMHLHLSLWRGGVNTFAGDQGISETALHFIGGILEHARSLAALVAPTTNSYRRLAPGYEAPVAIAWGYRNRSAMIRVPAPRTRKHYRVEFRTPDPTANPYLAIAATIMAGLDGIRRKIDPGEPLQKSAYKLTPKEAKELGIGFLPKTLDEALDELESDNEYLKPVFTSDVIQAYIEVKRREAEQVRLVPHPYEIYLYGGL